MVKRRVSPYIVGVCIVAVLSMFYVGIRVYQRNVELKQVLSDAQMFNREVAEHHGRHEHNHTEADNHHAHSSDNHTHGRENPSLEVARHHEHSHTKGENEYFYELGNGIKFASNYPKSKEDLELDEWIETGKLTPFVEQELKRREQFRRNHNVGRLLQQVVTPDGQLGQVVVYDYNMYKEEDAIFESEFVTPESRPDLFPAKPWRGVALILSEISDPEGVEHFVPDEYYEITDPYEREEYFNKFEHSIVLGISMDEVEAKIAAGELDVSLSDSNKQHVDESLARYAAIEERTRLIDMGWPKPTPLDKPPVKVRIKPEPEIVDGLSGLKHRESILAGGEVASDESSSTSDVVAEQPQSKRQVDRDVDQSFPRRSEEPEDVTRMPEGLLMTPETIKAQLKEQLTPEQFLKAQRLLDEHGAEEGLRQFREMPSPEQKGVRNSHKKP